ncbi:hypothetical protein ABTQ02_18965, partial [Acinetobacter baumannii]
MADMVALENLPHIARFTGAVDLRDAIEPLAADAKLRARIGAANRAKALALYDEATMVGRYARLYGSAIGKPDAFT